jgi:hypothetical protein
VLLRDVHPQPWLDVFAGLPVHALASFPFSRWRRCSLLLHKPTATWAPVSQYALGSL